MHKNKVLISKKLSSVARFETIRIVLALAAQLQWTIYQFDVKSTFLNRDLMEKVYVTQPQGFIVEGKEVEESIVWLETSSECVV